MKRLALLSLLVLGAAGLVQACTGPDVSVAENGAAGEPNQQGAVAGRQAGGSASVAGRGTGTTETPACDNGCGDSECGTAGSCTLTAACKVVDCGTAIFDDNACVRSSCQGDDDCAADERCASIWLSRHYQCVQNGDNCDCTAGLGLFPLTICSPVKLAGARGQWQSLHIGESVIGDTTEHTFATDGSVTVARGPAAPGGASTTMAELSAEDLDQLRMLINGAALRRDLTDPTDCPLTKSYDAIVQLRLDGTLLEKNVAGCLGDDAAGVASFKALMALVSRY